MSEFLEVICMLMRQINGEGLKIFNNNWVGVPIVTVWMLFGCNLIMDQLYTGEIFSCLTAMTQPPVPTTFSGLIDSDLHFVTSSWYATGVGTQSSMLQGKIIPVYKAIFKNISGRMNQLREMERRMILVNTTSFQRNVEVFENITESRALRHAKGWVDTVKPFAIMDPAYVEVFWERVLKISGRQHVLNVREDTPFHIVMVTYVDNNFMSEVFRGRLAQLASFGIAKLWTRLDEWDSILVYVRSVYGELVQVEFRKAMAGVQDTSLGYEDEPVLFKYVQSLFILGTLILAAAFLGFMIECRNPCLHNVKFLYELCGDCVITFVKEM
ncbi:hypothetical protein Fcan01_11412 [Folsomia candida]|uniref:Uncharacterized protein n=1 Tax=Folsomia candida TaxID=158441 RepID=A0A226E769_FOLCA|nr:hypothetical protein Fcan01_11412 [Folsomia candida]